MTVHGDLVGVSTTGEAGWSAMGHLPEVLDDISRWSTRLGEPDGEAGGELVAGREDAHA